VPIEDTHEFITELEKNGELKRVKTEVDSNLEIAEILRREMYSNGSAILFENVKGYDIPVLGNAFGSMKRLEIGRGMTDFTEIGQRIAEPLEYISLLNISAISKLESTSVFTRFNSPFFSSSVINS